MDRVERFINWFTNLGGFIPEETKKEIKHIFNPVASYGEHSFKDNPKEVKEKYNHKFKRVLTKEDFLSDTPDIDKLFFERKDDKNT